MMHTDTATAVPTFPRALESYPAVPDQTLAADLVMRVQLLSLIHISEPTRPY